MEKDIKITEKVNEKGEKEKIIDTKKEKEKFVVKKLEVPFGTWDFRELFQKDQKDYEQLMINQVYQLTDEVFKLTGNVARLNIALELLCEKICGIDLKSYIKERGEKARKQLDKALNEKN